MDFGLVPLHSDFDRLNKTGRNRRNPVAQIPQIAVDSELASARNVVIRSLSPDRPFRTLVLAWRQASPRRTEFRTLGNLIRASVTGAKRTFTSWSE
jgi:DNA-binding transcriptional LysR family regulator